MFNDVMFSSAKDDWETPQDFFDSLNQEFHFSLDAAASDSNAKCPIYFTKSDNALLKNWGGYTVFCNPPYGREIADFVKKSYEESKKPNTSVVMLLPARTDTKWFHEYILGKAEIRFLRGRLKFVGAVNQAPFPSMVVVFRSGRYEE